MPIYGKRKRWPAALFLQLNEYDHGYREDPTDQRQLVLLLRRPDDGFEMRPPHQTASDPGAGGESMCGTDRDVHAGYGRVGGKKHWPLGYRR